MNLAVSSFKCSFPVKNIYKCLRTPSLRVSKTDIHNIPLSMHAYKYIKYDVYSFAYLKFLCIGVIYVTGFGKPATYTQR